MADLTIVATEVLQDDDGQRKSGFAGEAITAGQPVFYDQTTNRWYKATSVGTLQGADVGGIALNSAAIRQSLRIQLEGAPILGASAGLVVGTVYGLSFTPGGIAPLADAKINQYQSVIGVGAAENRLRMGLVSSGVLPGSVLNTQLVKFVMAANVSDDTAQVGAIIDRNGYEEVTFCFNLGTMADAAATFTVLLEGGNVSNLSDAAAVADADMVTQTIGTAPETAASWTQAHDGQVRKLGYLDNTTPYRYLRVTVTPSGNAAAATFAVYCVLGAGTIIPVVQPAA